MALYEPLVWGKYTRKEWEGMSKEEQGEIQRKEALDTARWCKEFVARVERTYERSRNSSVKLSRKGKPGEPFAGLVRAVA